MKFNLPLCPIRYFPVRLGAEPGLLPSHCLHAHLCGRVSGNRSGEDRKWEWAEGETPSGAVEWDPCWPVGNEHALPGGGCQAACELPAWEDGGVIVRTSVLREKLGWDPGGRERRAGCIFQEGEKIEEISNYKDNGIVWLVLSAIVGSQKTDKRLWVINYQLKAPCGGSPWASLVTQKEVHFSSSWR